MRAPIKVYDSLAPQLLEKIKQGDSVFYIGSNVLSPPRYKYTEQMMDLAESEQLFRKLQQENPTAGKVTKAYREVISKGIYKGLKDLIHRVWPEPGSALDSIGRMTAVKSVVTTLFDTHLEDVSRKYRPVDVLTGSELATSEKLSINKSKKEDELHIYALLGVISEPDTLFVSEKMITELGKAIFYSESKTKFMENLLRNKILVVVGYDIRDPYDSFFPALLNSITYEAESPIIEDIYVADSLRYNTSYGRWAGRDEIEMKYINIEATQFLKELKNALDSG